MWNIFSQQGPFFSKMESIYIYVNKQISFKYHVLSRKIQIA